MIKKIKSINKIAVYEDFDWDKSIKNKDGTVEEFKKINPNCCSVERTTLSRIIRTLETGSISEKYDNDKKFSILIDDKVITQEHPLDHTKVIRVFNEDFVRENISFPYNDDGNIKSFAIMGDSNNEIQNTINGIMMELGVSEEGKNKTGLYKDQEVADKLFNQAKHLFETEEKNLNDKLSNKASGDRKISIKYRSDLYGDQNYNIKKLHDDIRIVLADDYIPLSEEDKEQKIKLLRETTKNAVQSMNNLNINFDELLIKSKSLIILQS